MPMRARTLLLSSALSLAMVACGEDDSTSYTIDLSLSDTTLAADGTSGATLSVTVLDDSGGPPPIGSQVFIQCQDDGGNESLWIGAADEVGRGVVPLDTIGIGTENVRCSGDDGSDYQVQCIAAFEGATGFLAPFTCETSVES